MALPQSAADAGNNLHNNFLDTIRNLPSLVVQAAAHALPGGQAIAAAPASVGAMVAPTADFVHGLMTGHALASGPQLQARVATSAPAKATAPANPDAGQTVTLGNGMTVTLPSAAWLKAHPATPAPQGSINDVGGSVNGGGAVPAAAAAPAAPPTNFDILRSMALSNPGMTRGDIGTVASALAQLSPVKGMSPLDAAKMATMQQFLARNDAITQQALAAAGDNPLKREKALTDNLTNMRALVASPNVLGDVNAAMGYGGLPQPGAAQ